MLFVKLPGFLLAGGMGLSMMLPTHAEPASRLDNRTQNLVVPLDKPSAECDAAERQLTKVMANLPGKADRKPEFVAVAPGQAALWGDLFQTGDCFALVEVSPSSEESGDAGVGFAEWTGDRWQLRQMWRIGTVWRPAGWEPDGNDYLPATPATQPFLLEDFSGDGVPEVVIAGEVDRYFQGNYPLRFLPKTRELKLVAYAMAKPERVEDYVRLEFDSGRRAIWSEWEFCQWAGDELRSVASWHSEVGYGESDPTFVDGMRMDSNGKPVTIRVLLGHGPEFAVDAYEVSRNGLPFGTMRVGWRDPENLPQDADDIEGAWLFEKITGLPRRLYPGRENEEPPDLEKFAAITIEGNNEAEKVFSTERP